MVRPRDAASLVVTRGDGPKTKVLLGRRPPNDRFMPNVHVFPGGRVDGTDTSLPSERNLPKSVARRLERRATPKRARALAVAALRETYEETGLVFGKRAGESIRPDLSGLDYIGRAITPWGNPIRYHARFLRARVETSTGRLKGNGELLDLGWYSIEEALKLTIIDVTEAMLEQLRARVTGDQAHDLFVHYRGMQRVITHE
ncbi:MAG: NUDIX hydrolase [Candidatus Binatia bacterium]|nr:NUDIX hydrolase [Candidatus Binatia bacterium]